MLLMGFLISNWETFVLLKVAMLGLKSGPAVEWAEMESSNVSGAEKSPPETLPPLVSLGQQFRLLSQILNRGMEPVAFSCHGF